MEVGTKSHLGSVNLAVSVSFLHRKPLAFISYSCFISFPVRGIQAGNQPPRFTLRSPVAKTEGFNLCSIFMKTGNYSLREGDLSPDCEGSYRDLCCATQLSQSFVCVPYRIRNSTQLTWFINSTHSELSSFGTQFSRLGSSTLFSRNSTQSTCFLSRSLTQLTWFLEST